MPATPRPRPRARTEYSPGRVLPALEDVDRLTAWAAPQFQRSRSRLVGPRVSPESLPPFQFPDLALLPAIFAAASVPVRLRQRGAQAPPFVLDDLWTGFVLWLAQDVQPQRRRAVPRPEAGSTLWPGVVADDVVTMGAWITPPWPVRQTRQPARTQQGEPPAAALVDLPAWPVLDFRGDTTRRFLGRGRSDTAAPAFPPDADAVLWLAWNVQSFTPTPRPRRSGAGDTFRSSWFDTLIVDILLPRAQEAVIRRPAPRTARGASELPVVVQTDAAPYTALFVQQPRPRTPRPLVRVQAEDVTAVVMGAAPPAVGGPYTVLVGQIYTAGAVAGTLQSE